MSPGDVQALVRPVMVADRSATIARYREVRGFTEALAAPLLPEDQVVQSMPDASPTKWHRGHTTWFFETFVLASSSMPVRPFNPHFKFILNSYYEAVGPRYLRSHRGFLSRPSVSEITHYRQYVDEEMERWAETASEGEWSRLLPLLELGLNHEQQHQELLLTDIKHVLFQNPMLPKYSEDLVPPRSGLAPALKWIDYEAGLLEVGHPGEGFAFDNEGPRHQVFIGPFRLASRLVSNGEFLEFVEDGGYEDARHWLSSGIAAVREQGWRSPHYWVDDGGEWREFTLGGLRDLQLDAPVCHVNYFEADAFARWAGKRLPTEFEWEVATAALGDPISGNMAETGVLHPQVAPEKCDHPVQLYGDVWEWTRSAYGPYPGFRPAEGAVGEYNGKFMSGQMVLRGGSCVTPPGHLRATYRNFFQPPDRWQFTGLRLAAEGV